MYGSIFTPRLHWKDIDADRSRLHKGVYVLEFKEHDDEVLVTAVSTQDGSLKEWRTKRLFLAAGHFATTRIIARSLGRINEPIRILDSQYFFFPFLSYRAFPRPPQFTLAEVFLEVLNEELSKHFVHLQVYGMNEIFSDTLRTFLPRPLPLSPITSRFFLFQGFSTFRGAPVASSSRSPLRRPRAMQFSSEAWRIPKPSSSPSGLRLSSGSA